MNPLAAPAHRNLAWQGRDPCFSEGKCGDSFRRSLEERGAHCPPVFGGRWADGVCEDLGCDSFEVEEEGRIQAQVDRVIELALLAECFCIAWEHLRLARNQDQVPHNRKPNNKRNTMREQSPCFHV
jgi:hypothetical protein